MLFISIFCSLLNNFNIFDYGHYFTLFEINLSKTKILIYKLKWCNSLILVYNHRRKPSFISNLMFFVPVITSKILQTIDFYFYFSLCHYECHNTCWGKIYFIRLYWINFPTKLYSFFKFCIHCGFYILLGISN